MTLEIPYDMPAIPPPNGGDPNFDNPPSIHTLTVGVGATCMTIMALAVGIRTYTKAFILKDMRHEDCACNS
jgi:hypothetical protein